MGVRLSRLKSIFGWKEKKVNIMSAGNIIYISGEIFRPLHELRQIMSNNEIKRKIKEKAINISYTGNSVWLKIGKKTIVIREKFHFVAELVSMWWEYHHVLKPKSLEWKKASMEDYLNEKKEKTTGNTSI